MRYDRGLAYAEAYPARDARSDAASYHGPSAMYLAAGFSLHRGLEGYLVVRKPLAKDLTVHGT